MINVSASGAICRSIGRTIDGGGGECLRRQVGRLRYFVGQFSRGASQNLAIAVLVLDSMVSSLARQTRAASVAGRRVAPAAAMAAPSVIPVANSLDGRSRGRRLWRRRSDSPALAINFSPPDKVDEVITYMIMIADDFFFFALLYFS